jgi:hypothetical protein
MSQPVKSQPSSQFTCPASTNISAGQAATQRAVPASLRIETGVVSAMFLFDDAGKVASAGGTPWLISRVETCVQTLSRALSGGL